MKTIKIEIESSEFSRIESGIVETNGEVQLDDILNYVNTGLEKGYQEKIEKLNKIINTDLTIETLFGGTHYYKKDTKPWIDAVFGQKNKKIQELKLKIENKERIIAILAGTSTGLLIHIIYLYIKF